MITVTLADGTKVTHYAMTTIRTEVTETGVRLYIDDAVYQPGTWTTIEGGKRYDIRT